MLITAPETLVKKINIETFHKEVVKSRMFNFIKIKNIIVFYEKFLFLLPSVPEHLLTWLKKIKFSINGALNTQTFIKTYHYLVTYEAFLNLFLITMISVSRK